jgi:hypothetical protein
LCGYKLSDDTACVGAMLKSWEFISELVGEQGEIRVVVLDRCISLCGVDLAGQPAGSGGEGSRIVVGGGPGGGLLPTLPSCLLCSRK